MTNKKFKMAAMSLALTACVAASPLAANAEAPDVQTENDTSVSESASEPSVQETPSQEDTAPAEQAPVEASEEESASAEETSEEEQASSENEEETAHDEQTPAEESKEEPSEEAPAPAAPQISVQLPSAAPVSPMLPAAAASDAAASADAQISLMIPGDGVSFAINAGQASIQGNDNVIYGTLDDAIKNANNDDVLLVREDVTSDGIVLQDKNLTIQGVSRTDDATNTTVKPKLTFKNGISIKNAELVLKNLDVDMTGISSTPNVTDSQIWMGICLAKDSTLTLDNTDLNMDGIDCEPVYINGTKYIPQGIYMDAQGGYAHLNVLNDSHLTIDNYDNAVATDAARGVNAGSKYEFNIRNGSSFNADGNEAGIVGMESLTVTVEQSEMHITNCTRRHGDEGRSGTNGANFVIDHSTVDVSGCQDGYGLHANDLSVKNSTLTANNNGYSGIRITGKGEFIDSTVTVSGTLNKGNAALELANIKNETGSGRLIGSLAVTNSRLTISGNSATGVRCNSGTSFQTDDLSTVRIRNNAATPDNGWNRIYDTAGGLLVRNGASATLGANTVINNNHAGDAGDDLFIEAGGSLTFSVRNATGSGDTLDDCSDGIDGWYTDASGQRWAFHSDDPFAVDLLDENTVLADGITLKDNGDGTYTLTAAAGSAGVALKAAHAEPAPEPVVPGTDEPDPEDPSEPENTIPADDPILPQDPVNPPVQDARMDSPVLPQDPVKPPVQDARFDGAALPRTGTSLPAALTMALSGLALMASGAWASLTGKNSRH